MPHPRDTVTGHLFNLARLAMANDAELRLTSSRITLLYPPASRTCVEEDLRLCGLSSVGELDHYGQIVELEVVEVAR